MRKILLVIEDYSELVYLETILKKIGFDVVGMRSEVSLNEKMLSFSPDILVITALGNRLNGIKVLEKLKRKQGQPKVVLLSNRSTIISPKEIIGKPVDAIVESPVNALALIETLADLGGLDIAALTTKFEKLGFRKDTGKEESMHISGGSLPEQKSINVTGLADYHKRTRVAEDKMKSRIKSYDKLIEKLPRPEQHHYTSEKVADLVKESRKSDGDPEVEAIDKERKSFVKALFKK